jgi:hypothetical protein
MARINELDYQMDGAIILRAFLCFSVGLLAHAMMTKAFQDR